MHKILSLHCIAVPYNTITVSSNTSALTMLNIVYSVKEEDKKKFVGKVKRKTKGKWSDEMIVKIL
jgi:hypothetical protein